MEKISPENTAVILVNYNNPRDSLNCLECLDRLASPPLAILLVDNGSAPEKLEALCRGWRRHRLGSGKVAPSIHNGTPAPQGPQDLILPLPCNKGFAAGNNAAIDIALAWPETRAIWLLNNDTLPEPDSLIYLCDELSGQRTPGIAGSSVIYARQPGLLQCAGGGRLNKWFGTSSLIGDGYALEDLKQPPEPDFILGASMLCSRKVMERCGQLDENYFLYYEEVDYCLRAKSAGFSLGWARDSQIRHLEGASTGASGSGSRKVRRPAYVDYLSIRNRFYLMKKYFPLSLPAVFAGLGISVLRRIRRGESNRIPMLLKGAWNGIRGRMGQDFLPAADQR